MFKDAKVYSGFAVNDLDVAQRFYGETLGLEVERIYEGRLLQIKLAGETSVLIYPKDDFVPATYTILNLPVPDIEASVRELKAAGIRMESYDVDGGTADENGIHRGDGPTIAWFKDPAGKSSR